MRGVLVGATLLAMGTPLARAGATESVAYTYDALGRLVTIQSSGPASNGQVVTTTFDAAGNRSNYTVSGVGTPPSLSIGSASATEGGNLVFTVTLSPNVAGAVTVSYATANGTATASGDYTAASGTLTFAAGEITKTVTILTSDDTAAEAAETMTVTLSNATGGAAIGTASGTGTINDNDTVALANLAISSADVTEGGSLSFAVTRAGNTSITASVSYTATSGSAISGNDFIAASSTLTFGAGEISKTINITTIDDSVAEPPETLIVTLSGPSSGAAITTPTATGTINDNDTPIAITDQNLAVLPQHAGTYNCYYGPMTIDWGWGTVITYWVESCMLNSNSSVVYDRSNGSAPTFAHGYVMPSLNQLTVQPPYYGTAIYP